MPKLALPGTLALTMFLLLPSSALALAHAVFVSGTGGDGQACTSPASACRSITSALTKVSPSGVIHIAPGNYAAVTITKAVELIADSGQASIAGSGAVGGCEGVLTAICIK